MSSALTVAIASRLNGTEVITGYPTATAAQSGLASLLGTVTQSNGVPKPAILFASKSSFPLLFPAVTFRPCAGQPDLRFRDGLKVEGALYDVEIWDNGRDSTLITDIAEYIEELLDSARALAPVLPMTKGYCYWAESTLPLNILVDSKINAWVGVTRYRFEEARF